MLILLYWDIKYWEWLKSSVQAFSWQLATSVLCLILLAMAVRLELETDLFATVTVCQQG